MSTLETRLAALEKANRRYRTIFIAFAGLILAAVITSFTGNIVPDKLQAKKFEVVDNKGNVLVSMGSYEGDGNITTYNQGGALLVDIIPSTGGQGGVVVWNGNGKKNLILSNIEGGGGQMVIYNRNEQKVVAIGRNTLNAGSIMLSDNLTNNLVHITGDTNGDGTILTYKNNGTQSSRLPQ